MQNLSEAIVSLNKNLPSYQKAIYDLIRNGFSKLKDVSKFKLAMCGIFSLYLLNGFLKSKGFYKKKSVIGKHVVVTGGGSGIGKGISIAFAQLGAKVTILDINLALAESVVKHIELIGGEAQAFVCDVGNPEHVKSTFENLIRNFGKVHILVNNAGVVIGKTLLDASINEIQKTFSVNTLSMFYTTKEVLPKMMETNEGHIVTIASLAGKCGASKLVDYCSSKFAAVGFNESLRLEMKKKGLKIRTTLICPYYISTGMFKGVKDIRISWLMPISTTEEAVKRIMNGILQEEEEVIFPNFGYTIPFLRSLLPISMSDWITTSTGANNSMDSFVGRK